jgi:membrane-bound ClpP family serine protease
MEISMMTTLTVVADDFKLYQALEKFSSQYYATYTLTRENGHFALRIKTENFGELVRRLNLIKGCTYKIREIVNTDPISSQASMNLTKTNIDALIGRETLAQTDLSPVDGGLVKLFGELWFSRPVMDGVISKGSRVRIVKVEGVSLLVEEVDKTDS